MACINSRKLPSACRRKQDVLAPHGGFGRLVERRHQVAVPIPDHALVHARSAVEHALEPVTSHSTAVVVLPIEAVGRDSGLAATAIAIVAPAPPFDQLIDLAGKRAERRAAQRCGDELSDRSASTTLYDDRHESTMKGCFIPASRFCCDNAPDAAAADRRRRLARRGALPRLVDEGHSVEVAARAVDGRHRSRSSEYDLVVLDLGLPDGDGLALCREARAHGVVAPILVLTARDGLLTRSKDSTRAPMTTSPSRSTSPSWRRGSGRCCAEAARTESPILRPTTSVSTRRRGACGAARSRCRSLHASSRCSSTSCGTEARSTAAPSCSNMSGTRTTTGCPTWSTCTSPISVASSICPIRRARSTPFEGSATS